MRVLVCGGRRWSDTDYTYAYLNFLHSKEPITSIIEGDAKGADRMAGYWARKNHIDNYKYKADWKQYGKSAGPIRNKQMLEEGKPDLVVAFPGGKGTAHMVELAKKAGVEVIQIDLEAK
jgi:hypothetical protein